MAFYNKLHSYNEIESVIQEENGLALFYFSSPDCGVCSVIKPKIQDLLKRYPVIRGYDINLKDDPLISGQLSLYSLPAVLVFSEGREVLREARFIVMDLLEPKITRLLGNIG